jgi:PAS domain S-box-containing protein
LETECDSKILAQLVDGIPHAVLFIGQDYQVRYRNPAVQAPQSSMCYQAAYRRPVVCDQCPLPQVVESRKPVTFTHLESVDGQTRLWESTVSPVFDTTGGVQGVSESAVLVEQVEEALHHERDLTARIMETSPVCIAVIDPSGQVIFANAQAERVLGIERSQHAYTSPPWRFTYEDGRPFPNEDLAIRKVVDTQQPVYDVRHTLELPDGRRVLLTINAAPLVDPHGNLDGVVAVFEDITERDRVEQALQASEHRFRQLFNLAPLAVAVATPEGYFWEVNNAFEEMFGYTRAEITSKRIVDLTHPDDEKLSTEFFTAIAKGEQDSVQFDKRYIRKDGQIIWGNIKIFHINQSEQGQPVVIGLISDITDRKKTEANLRRERDLTARIMETSPVSVVVLNRAGQITFANGQAEQLLHLAKTPMTQRAYDFPAWEITGSEGQFLPETDLPFRYVMENGQPVYDVRRTIHWPDGSWKLLSINAAPLMNEQGTFDGMVATLDDITARVQADEALRENQERYQLLFDTMLDGYALHEMIYDEQGQPANYRFLDVNMAWERATGFRREDVIGKTVLEVMPETERSWIQTYGIVAVSGKIIRFENYSKAAGGRWYECVAFRPKENHFAVIFQDVTDRRQAEDALRASMETSADIVRSIPSGLFIYQYEEPDKLILLQSNPEAERLTKISVDRWRGHSFDEIWPQEFGLDAKRTCLSVMQTGIMYEGEFVYDTAGRNVFHVRAFRMPQNRLGIAFENVGQLKHAEEAALRRANQLALLNEVGTRLAGLLSMDEVFENAVQLIQQMFDYEHVGLFIPHSETQMLILRAKAGLYASRFPADHALKPGQGMVGWTTQTGQTLLSNDVRSESHFFNPFSEMVIQSELTVPIKLGETVVGVLDVQSSKQRAFDDTDVIVIETLARMLSATMQNARLFEAERRDRALAQTFQRATQTLSDFMDIREALNMVADLLAEVVYYDRVLLLLVEENYLNPVVARGFPDNEQALEMRYYYPHVSLLHRSMIEGETEILRMDGDRRFDAVDLPAFTPTVTTWVGVPLIAADVVIGYLSVATERTGGYTRDDVDAIEAFAHQAVLAVSRSRLLDQLQQTQTLLTRVARLSVAGEVAAGVAHQINNPLTTVIAQTHLLLKASDPEKLVYQRAEKIRQAAYRAASIVQRMLDFARTHPYNMQLIDINESVQSAVALIRAQVEPHIARVSVLLPVGLPTILGSREHLEDVWINLLLNARDAVEGVENAHITITTQVSGSYVLVRVEDNGPGIPFDIQARIFEPFFTTKKHGTGLGLSICHEVVTQHGGTVTIESELGRGTAFVVSLPVWRKD